MSEETTPRTDVMLTGNSEPSVDEYEDLATFARNLERDYNRVVKEQNTAFEHRQEAAAQFRDGTWHGNTTQDYADSTYVDPAEETAFLSLAYQWQDKPHRHVHDLCEWVDKLQDENKDFRELVRLLTIQEMSDSGRIFYPNGFTSCRAMDGERMGQITEKYRPTPHISTEEYHGE
jgi:hypothetical protein